MSLPAAARVKVRAKGSIFSARDEPSRQTITWSNMVASLYFRAADTKNGKSRTKSEYSLGRKTI
jgi:hypothetical protein